MPCTGHEELAMPVHLLLPISCCLSCSGNLDLVLPLLRQADGDWGCFLADRGQDGLGKAETICNGRKKEDGGKSRSYRSRHSHAFGRNFASPCLHSVVVDFAIFDPGKQDLCAQ